MNTAFHIAESVTVHNILERKKLFSRFNFNAIKHCLEQDSSSVNEVRNGYQPLHVLLRSDDCQEELVKLLLEHGADVNASDNCLIPPLLFALRYCSGKCVKILLEGGADPNAIHAAHCSLLCLALHDRDWDVDVVQKLLDSSTATSATAKSWCNLHTSLLQCYTRNKHLRNNTVKLLIKYSEAREHPSSAQYCGRSTFCWAMGNPFREESVIELILGVGDSVRECKYHFSPLYCYIDKYVLKASIIQLLLGKRSDLSKPLYNGNTLLHLAFRDCESELEALKLLLNYYDGNVNIKNNNGYTLLHCALLNPHYSVNIVKLLLEKGSKLDESDNSGSIPLHLAVAIWESTGVLIRILVNSGSPLEVQNNLGMTPLEYAISRNHTSAIKILLAAGAFVNFNILNHHNCFSYERNYKSLLKYFCLQNWNCSFRDYFHSWANGPYANYVFFVDKCISEIERMSSIYISQNVTLWEFADSFPNAEMLFLESREYNFNELFGILSKNTFPVYFEVIWCKIKKVHIKSKLQELLLYIYGSPFNKERKIILNYDCSAHIASFLTDKDLLNFMLAFNV